MPIRPRDKFAGQKISARDQCASNAQDREAQLVAGPGLRVNRRPGGTVVSAINKPSRRGSSAATIPPFKILQQNATPPNATSDWRTFVVHHGFLNATAPDNDDAAVDSLVFTVDADVNVPDEPWLVWLRCVRDEAGNIEDLRIQQCAFADRFSLWVNYPNRQGPANIINYLIGTINTGSDDPDDDDYQSVTIHQILNLNLTETLLLQPFAPGTLYQFITDPNAITNPEDWRTFNLVEYGVVTDQPAIVIAASATEYVWLEYDFSDGSWLLNHGDTLPAQMTITDIEDLSGPWIIELGSITTSDDDTRTFTITRTRQAPVITSETLFAGFLIDSGPPTTIKQQLQTKIFIDGSVIAVSPSDADHAIIDFTGVTAVDTSELPNCEPP